MKEQRVYLVHVAECIAKIERHAVGGEAAFLGSETIQDAALRNLQVMCESTQMLDPGWKTAHGVVDWRRISDFRNRLVHDYLGVDLAIVWKVMIEDVPHLKELISTALVEMSP